MSEDLFALCRCRHWQISHAHDYRRRRTFCTHADETGLCACERYESPNRMHPGVASSDSPRQCGEVGAARRNVAPTRGA